MAACIAAFVCNEMFSSPLCVGIKAMRYDENLNICGVSSGRFHIISYSCTLVI